jgi:long-chain acyl-CoA synthetase
MEASTAAAASRRALGASTMAEAFRYTAEDHGDRVAFRTKDDSVSLTWGQLRERVDALAGGLAGLGVQRGDTVALMFTNRPEFNLADLAVMTLGATPFSLYATSSPEQIQYVLNDAEAKVALVEQAFLEPMQAAKGLGLDALEQIVVLEGAQGEGTVGWDDVEGSNPDFDVEAAWRAIEPDDLLTLIYTSGTTGPPKGVQLTHRNVMAGVESTNGIIEFPDAGKVISWLPAAHIAERMAHHYLPVVFGLTVTTCPNPKEIVQYLPAVKPTWFFAVPRIFEKLRGAMLGGVFNDEQKLGWLKAAEEKVRLEQAGEEVPDELAAKVEEGQQLLGQVAGWLGLDEAIAVNAGAAPTPPEVITFFHAINVPLGELWGMSETCGVGLVNPPDRIKIGTVGPPVPGVEVKLAEDGELLMRADCVMQGYRNLPDKTAEALDSDGWLHTGDIAEIDEDGYVSIVDRKKEIIINAAGKNMSPANIESTLKAASPVIGQAAVIGDRRPYNTALIVLDADAAPVLAQKLGIDDASMENLARDERVRAVIQEAVDTANAKLARVEQVRKFTLLPTDWTPGGEELTPTMKLKRKPIAEKYQDEIEAMYSG